MYIDLIVVKHDSTDTQNYVFKAPAFSHIKEGDKVEVETCHGPQMGTVMGRCVVTVDSEEYKCFALMARMKPFKKVLSVYSRKELDYKEEEESEETADEG